MMRKIYPPHHPKIIQYLIQLGYFNILNAMFKYIYGWIQQKGTIIQLYNNIG